MLIEGFNESFYLEANPDVKEAIEKKNFKDSLHHLKIFGLEEIKKGLRKFHPDYKPFNEELYIILFPEVEDYIRENKYDSAFDHFCKIGYKEIIEGKRKWLKTINDSEIFYGIDYFFRISSDYLFISGWVFSTSEKDNDIKIYIDKQLVSVKRFSREDLKTLENIDNKWKNAGFWGIVKNNDNNDLFKILFIDNENNFKILKHHLNEKYSPKEKSEIILNYIDTTKKDFVKDFEIIGIPLQKMWEEYYSNLELDEEVLEFGEINKYPKLSIIIPLYGRVDFIEFQNAVFSTDQDFLDNVELIYVLDDPDKFYESIYDICNGAYNIYNVPMKLVRYKYNLGYARANNIGVKYANSNMILLLNSDVFPKQKGWVSKILEKYKKLKNPGVLGFKLLYEDESIQHAGMEFRKNEYVGDMWINYHPLKGLMDNQKEDKIEKKPAVTGACMLLEKNKYLEVGGFSENYVLGDFEDSDLCLKLREKGYEIYYSTKPEFYHLERQSQSLFSNQLWKHKITLFNCWQHTKRWDNIIKGIK